jgi:hypothetical protein
MFWNKKKPTNVKVMEVNSFISALRKAKEEIEKSRVTIPTEEMHKQALQATLQLKDPQKTSQVLLGFFDSLQEESRLVGKIELIEEIITKLEAQQ